MDNENPSSGFVVSDQILGGFSVTECFQSKVISSKEEKPSDVVQFDQTLVGSSAIDESRCSERLIESTQVESGKIDDNENSKTETLDVSVPEDDGKLEGAQIKNILDDSLKEESEDAEFTKNLAELSPIAIEGDKEIGQLNCEKLLDSLDKQIDFGNNAEDGVSEEDLRLIPGPWSEGHIRNRCNCGRCFDKEEEEFHWRNHGTGWPSSTLFPNGHHHPRRHGRRRSHNFRRERETEIYGWTDCLGRDSEPELCPVGAGLANLGNTCFLNAIMQCFTHTVPLVQGLLSLKHGASNHGADEFCVLCAMCEQIEYSLAYSGRVISPSNLVDNLSHISSDFRRYQQEDAHEFLQCLLDKLDSNWSNYESSANDLSGPYDTLVKQIFGGRLVSQVRCCSCGHNSETCEPLIDLSLEIEDADSIESALKSFTKVESIEETEKFTCDSCKEQVKVEKQLMLDQAPSVAALHLKRFKSDGYFVEKIDKKVHFPLELDLAPYTKGLNGGNEDLEYELFAVVVHVGLSSTSGHYFCFIRTSPERWYRFDDSKVTMIDEETVLSQDAYILFYAKKGTPWFDSLIENWKAECREKILSTSPKSVLDDMDLPSTSYPTRTGLDGVDTIETGVEVLNRPGETGNAMGDASVAPESELVQNTVKVKTGLDAWESAIANQTSVSSLMPMNNNVKVKEDSIKLDELFLMEENDTIQDKTCKETEKIEKTSSGGVCSPSFVKNTFDGEPKNEVGITPSTPPRASSPDIYSDEEPAEEAYCIPTNHLKIVDKPSSSAKKSVNTIKQDMKRKEAAKYIRKSMPGGRGQLFMAAISGSKSDSLLNKKRRKQASPLHARHSPKKRLKVSPKRVLRPVTA